MRLHPFEKISDIDTGNPYIEPVDIHRGERFLDVAKKFPIHTVFVKSQEFSVFPTSLIAQQSIHVYYDASGCVIGAEIMNEISQDKNLTFFWDSIDFLLNTMQAIADSIIAKNMNFSHGDHGIDIPELGLKYFCSDYENDLHCRIDCVYVDLECQPRQ